MWERGAKLGAPPSPVCPLGQQFASVGAGMVMDGPPACRGLAQTLHEAAARIRQAAFVETSVRKSFYSLSGSIRMRKFIFGGSGGATATVDFGLLALRVLAGLGLAFGHGITKLPPPDGFVKAVVGMGMPAFMAWGATFAELGCGILLALGLFTRPAATLILFTMCVAFFGVHFKQSFGKQELSLLYGMTALLFVIAGSGRFGIDSLIRK